MNILFYKKYLEAGVYEEGVRHKILREGTASFSLTYLESI